MASAVERDACRHGGQAEDRANRGLGHPSHDVHHQARRLLRLGRGLRRAGRGELRLEVLAGEQPDDRGDERLQVLRPAARHQFPSWTSGSSSHVAPALTRSSRRPGQDVRRRPSRSPAEASTHGPWHRLAIGLPRLGERPDERASGGGLPQQIRVDEPAGNQQPVVVVGVGLVERQVDAHPLAGSCRFIPRMWPGWIEITSTVAPASRIALAGTTSSTSSNPSIASTAIRRPARGRSVQYFS